ncbi:transketolase [Magnetofaba australis]|nr:transketolase [Magnetofaba australis]
MDATLKALSAKAHWVRKEMFRLHQREPETRIASSLSPIEMLTALYYGDLLKFDPKDPHWPGRDRLILSKGHGVISIYPILADVGFFPVSELEKIGGTDTFLSAIPDAIIPGFETTNGSLGHGVGVGCGMALALRAQKSESQVIVINGDGEMNEGSVWEGIMFAGHHGLDNLMLIIDDNKYSMLGAQKRVMGLDPMAKKLEAFGWNVVEMDGHDMAATHQSLKQIWNVRDGRPRAVISHTVKGVGVPELLDNDLCHVSTLKSERVAEILADLEAQEPKGDA